MLVRIEGREELSRWSSRYDKVKLEDGDGEALWGYMKARILYATSLELFLTRNP